MKEHPLVTTRVTGVLRERIRDLRSREMVRLSPERELAAELRVSRQSLRASIKTLVEEGLLVQRQGSGTYILPKLDVREVHLLKAADIKHDDPFYTAFLAQITSHISSEGLPLVIVQDGSLPISTHDAPLIILGYLNPATYMKARQLYRRIVAVQGHPMYKEVTQVDVNYYKIGFDSALEFAKRNHSSVLQIAGPDQYPAAAARRRGFEDATRETAAAAHVLTGKMNWNSGYSMGEQVAQDYVRRNKVTGIFAANDWMAIGLMTKLLELGVRIPDDVSVIGCDDISLAGEIAPGLTTFKEDFPLLISTVFQELNEMSVAGEHAGRQILLPARLVVRESLRTLSP